MSEQNTSGNTFLNPGMFEGTYEPKTVAEGEYQVRITDVTVKHSDKTGGDYISLAMDLIAEPEAKGVYHIMMFPTPQDDPKKKNNRLRAIQNMITCFGANVTENFNLKGLIGNMGWVLLREEEDAEYGMKNTVRKFILPKA